MNSIFDDITKSSAENDVEEDKLGTEAQETGDEQVSSEAPYTATQLKAVTQELLKYGLLEADRKPNLYQVAVSQHAAINAILEPLDLGLSLDTVRGLVFVVVSKTFGEEDDDWNHPLVRRQRLNLEQSVLLAILRQYYMTHEQEAGIGAGGAVVTLDELLSQLQIYLGDSGSDSREQNRVRTLLEALKGHGVVSEIDARDQVTIRPLITHLANPESLQSLLVYYREKAGGSGTTSAMQAGKLDEEQE